MLKLKQFEKIAFCYNGKQADLSAQVEKIMEEEGSLTTVYRIADGLHITNRARKIEKFGAYEWVNEIESTRATESKIISELWDGVLSLDIGHEERYAPRGGEPLVMRGDALLGEGFFVTVKEKRKAKVYLYREIP